jgi:hypothetical protein
MPAMPKPVSLLTEQRLRAVFAAVGNRTLLGPDLACRLREATAVPLTRQVAYLMMNNAVECGLLFRNGARKPFAYRIESDWQQPTTRPKRAEAGERTRRHGPALAYAGPAFGGAFLAPALGLRPRDPEVMPPEVGDLIDSLHQRFYRHGAGVECE